jgi:hypothetical protein
MNPPLPRENLQLIFTFEAFWIDLFLLYVQFNILWCVSTVHRTSGGAIYGERYHPMIVK